VTPINPVALALGPLSIRWYGVIIGFGAILAMLLAIREVKKFGYPSDLIVDLLIIALPITIIGARLYYVFFRWDYYRTNPSEIIAVWHGGLAIHGALIMAIITGFIYARRKNISFWWLADVAAPSLLLGQAIGRWGNFINQEAHGGPVSLAFLNQLHLPQFIINQMYIDGIYYHPTFLYESLWSFLGVIILFIWREKGNPRQGEVFLSYLVWYSIGRFYIEGLRTDSLAFDGPLWLKSFLQFLWSPLRYFFAEGAMDYGIIRIAQWISILLIVFAILILIYRRYSGLSDKRYYPKNRYDW